MSAESTVAESTASREAALQGRLTFLDNGPDAAAINIYGGVRPDSPAGTPADAAMATIPLKVPAGEVANGVLTLQAAEPGLITVTGTATWARVTNAAGMVAFDMAVGDMNSTANCKLSTVDLLAGGLVVLISATLS